MLRTSDDYLAMPLWITTVCACLLVVHMHNSGDACVVSRAVSRYTHMPMHMHMVQYQLHSMINRIRLRRVTVKDNAENYTWQEKEGEENKYFELKTRGAAAQTRNTCSLQSLLCYQDIVATATNSVWFMIEADKNRFKNTLTHICTMAQSITRTHTQTHTCM